MIENTKSFNHRKTSFIIQDPSTLKLCVVVFYLQYLKKFYYCVHSLKNNKFEKFKKSGFIYNENKFFRM